MRWLYIPPGDTASLRRRQEVIASIDAWWCDFADNEAALRRPRESDLDQVVEFINSRLSRIHPELKWELSAMDSNTTTMVITPESSKHLRPMVATLIERAPTLDGWRFSEWRLPNPPGTIASCVEARTGTPFPMSGCKASVAPHNLINLQYAARWNRDYSVDKATEAAFVTTEVALGEEILDKWIGDMSCARQLLATGFTPITDLMGRISELRRDVQSRLPIEPWVEKLRREGENVKGGLFKLGKNEMLDCENREDLIALTSVYPEMDSAAMSECPFSSERFSKFGEIFAYIKLDGSQVAGDEEFADRMSMEMALDEVLIPSGSGCTIGGGTGYRYSYITLAFTDVERGIELIRERLQRGRLTKRSWILFFDDTLRGEWVGIWDDSPPPPGRPA